MMMMVVVILFAMLLIITNIDYCANLDYCANHSTLTSANMHLIVHYTALIQHV